ncbi:hypothetical protein QJS04_geneDACA005773 [Acorus gramineus]|uniref:Uncharacterized protein n=1 Tax=Acorus gramineus TaxID=55184 RepID=A0AAV9BG93_ACOGR|nr:hypothetical protein QJS04_geneDACA005773 [Acorus gramineus]
MAFISTTRRGGEPRREAMVDVIFFVVQATIVEVPRIAQGVIPETSSLRSLWFGHHQPPTQACLPSHLLPWTK